MEQIHYVNMIQCIGVIGLLIYISFRIKNHTNGKEEKHKRFLILKEKKVNEKKR